MTWWPTLRSNSRTYSQVTTNNTLELMGCTSWYGHLFQKFNETTLYCPTCGQTRKVES